MHRTNQGTRDQTPFVRFREHTIGEFTIPVLRDFQRGLEDDFREAQLAFWLSKAPFYEQLQSEKFQLGQLS